MVFKKKRKENREEHTVRKTIICVQYTCMSDVFAIYLLILGGVPRMSKYMANLSAILFIIILKVSYH